VAERTGELSAKNADLEREVGERQRAEEALRSSQQRLLEVVEYSTNMFYSHDADGVITYVSPQSRRILGCEPEVALRRYHEFVTDNPLNELGFAATQRALTTGERQPPYQLELRGLDGIVRWVEINEAPVTRDGSTYAIVGSLTDITETKRAGEEHEHLQAQLRQAQKMEAVGRLAGGIAHDFNNLLTAVVGHTDLVASGLERDHPLQVELTEVRSAADRAASLVSQLLAFSRQQLIRRRVLDLDSVVTDSARMLRRMIGTDVELALELRSAPFCIEADRAQLDQVLINLALNARDAMPHGGRVIIETGTTELDRETIRRLDQNLEAGSYVTLRVTDTGHGMDTETVRHVFEPFFTTKDVGKGTGLGLATVYGIVTQNGGAVRIDSGPGGTTFHIYLPQVSKLTPETAAEGSAVCAVDPAEVDQKWVILVVEDEDAVRKLVCRTLERCGHEVLQAADGARALELCAQHDAPIDLLLTDMVMPGMNGREVAVHVSALLPDVRVLYMSGHTRDVLGSRFMLDERTQVLQKPFAPSDLVRHTREVMNGHVAPCA
jgi:PAS domain S-box-containing protein